MKILALIVCLSLMLVGCGSEQVVETETQYKVEPNVTPLPPNSSVSSTPVFTPPVVTPPPATPTYYPPTNINLPPQDPSAPIVDMSSVTSQPSWTTETVRVTGECAVDATKGSPAQAKLMAERCATLVAKRNMIERVAGLRIDSHTTVRDMVAESDLINADSSALLRDARVIDTQCDGVTARTTIELGLGDVYRTVTHQ